MRCPNRSIDEVARLQAIAQYGLLPGKVMALDPFVDMTARMFDCPAAAVNIIGDEKVCLVSSTGIDTYNDARDFSFCAHTILQDEVLVVEDATLDVRFHDNPLVGDGLIRFYAGVPLRTPSGHALGALCVIDSEPHAHFSHADRARLRAMATTVMDKLELRRLQAGPANRFEAAAAASPNAILCFDAKGRITEWNPAASRIFGYDAADIIGRSVEVLIAETDRSVARVGIARVLAGAVPKGQATELTALRINGEAFPVELYWSRWLEGDQVQFAAIVLDVTVRRSEHDALHYLANFDTLTGLPNRHPLRARVEETITADEPLALIVLDLNGYDDINNTLGHMAGDTVLAIVSERLAKAASEDVSLYSIGTGEFAALITACADPARLRTLARAITAVIGEPILVDGHEVRLTGNCGMALLPEHAQAFEGLLSNAQLALSRGKTVGRGNCCLFEPALRAEAETRRMYDAELHRAFERREFVLFYQPQFRLEDNALIGAEALLRWKHPTRGWLPPAAFLPALESSVLVEPTGRWILETACAQTAQWRTLQDDFRMSVNLFAAQLQSGDLPDMVREILDSNALPPSALELEITENIALEATLGVRRQFEDLRQFGIMLSFDDFGTGFASLTMLRNYPVTHIKIDKSFTQVVQTSDADRAIVKALIGLARDLGLGVTAEGIERQEECDFLRRLGCEKGQGYFFGKPVPAEIFVEQFLENRSWSHRFIAIAS